MDPAPPPDNNAILQQLAKHVGNPWNIDPLMHTGSPWKDMLLNAPSALMGMKGGMAPAGHIAPPEVGAKFTSHTGSVLPKVNQLPSVTPPDLAKIKSGVFNIVGGDNSNIPPVNPPSDHLSIIQKHKPYDFAAMNQSISKQLGDQSQLYSRYRHDIDRLVGNPVGPSSNQLIMNNNLVQSKEPTNYWAPGAQKPGSITNDLSPQTPARALFRKNNGQPITQEDLNQLKKLYPSEFPDDPDGQ